MRLSAHSPEEVCSTMRDFPDACPCPDGTHGIEAEHEDWYWMLQGVPHRLSCHGPILRPLISVSIHYLSVVWWEDWGIILWINCFSFLHRTTFKFPHFSHRQNSTLILYSSWTVLLTSTIVKPVLDDVTKEILAQKEEIARLKAVADQHPFYKYNGLWTRELQNLVCVLKFNVGRLMLIQSIRSPLLSFAHGWEDCKSTRDLAQHLSWLSMMWANSWTVRFVYLFLWWAPRVLYVYINYNNTN